MSWVKKCRNLIGGGGEYFPITVNILPMSKIWNYFFVHTASVEKIIRGNIAFNLFYQFVVNMGKYLHQKGKVRENNLCLGKVPKNNSCLGKVPKNNSCHKARVIFADLSLFRQIFPHKNHKLLK